MNDDIPRWTSYDHVPKPEPPGIDWIPAASRRNTGSYQKRHPLRSGRRSTDAAAWDKAMAEQLRENNRKGVGPQAAARKARMEALKKNLYPPIKE